MAGASVRSAAPGDARLAGPACAILPAGPAVAPPVRADSHRADSNRADSRRAASIRADADAPHRAPDNRPGRAPAAAPSGCGGPAAQARPRDRPAGAARPGAVPHRPGRSRGDRPVVAEHAPADYHRRPDHGRGRRARPARRVRVRRPGRADGPAAAAGEGHRLRPARPLARDGRPLRHHAGLRPRPADRLGLRGLRAREGDERDRDAADDLPGRADGHRRVVPAARRGRLLGPGRAPPP